MRRNLLLAATAAAVVLVLAAIAGVGRPEAARGDTLAGDDTVTTVGHGVVSVAPDRASVTAGVHTQASTAADALAQNAAKMNDVIAALKAAGGDDLQTQQVSLYPQTSQEGNVTGYTADNSVSASIAIAKAGALIDAAVKAGANNVSGPTLSVSDQDARYRDALKKAVDDARKKAQALAEAGGFAVGPISDVTEQGGVPRPVAFEAVAAKAADTPIEPGTQDITADVSVSFRIR